MLLFNDAASWPDPPVTTPSAAGALAQYALKPDAEYGWSLRRSETWGNGRVAELILTSQRWQNQLWRHQLFVYRPPQIRDSGRAILMIGSGQWSEDYLLPALPEESLVDGTLAPYLALADRLGTVIAVLRQVPAQPLFAEKLLEDAAIAHTFQQFLNTADLGWPLLLPMVKSAVRAMDAVGEYASRDWALGLTKFTLSGASKRGWTTWLTSAVDSRVVALAPQVIDLLKIPHHMALQLQSWGEFSEQLHDYTERNLQMQLLGPTGQLLLQTIDPYEYRERLRQPKFLLLGTNDRYWPLEALNLYWDELPGEKYVNYLPNSGHDLNDPRRVLGGIAAVHRHAAGELTLPKITWDFVESADGLELILRSNRKPAAARAWTAFAPTRDFRDAVWMETPMQRAEGEYHHRIAMPSDGFTALLGELEFDDPVLPYYLSSTVRVVPALE